MRESHRGVCVDAVGPVVEALENRQMLSASLLRGVLKIGGTTGADVITVSASRTQIIVNDGVKTSRFAKTGVKTISIVTGDGADSITIGSGIKQQITIKSGEGNDTVHGGSGREVVFAAGGDDLIFGGGGSDQIFGGNGADEIHGGSGNDYLYGDAGNDNLSGDAGNDVLAGDSEDTLVFAGQPPSNVIGNDSLNGGDGNDWLLGGTRIYFDTTGGHASDDGQDTFTGGAGNDIIDKGGYDSPGVNNDTVTDKESGDFVPVDDQPRFQEGQPGDVHTHVILKIRVRQGSKYKNVVVQPDIGFWTPTDLSALHTHDTSGLIHYEAAAGSPSYQLGHIGRFIPPAGKKVTMWVTRGASNTLSSTGKWTTNGGSTFQTTKFGGFVPIGSASTGAPGSPPMTGDIVEIRVG